MAIPTTTDRATRKPNALYLPTKYSEGEELSGYLQAVPYATYKAAGAMSKYDIAKFAKKTAYRYFNEEEKPQARSTQIATALRSYIFDIHRFGEKYTLLPEVKDRRQPEYKTASKAFGSENVFVGNEALGIIGMARAIEGNDESLSAMLSDGMTQVSGFHRNAETDVLIRTKLDKIVGKEGFIIKPVTSVAEADIPGLMFNASYHIEAALCIDAHKAITGQELDCIKFILVETTAPFQIAIVYLDDISVLVGRDAYIETLINYKKSLDTPESVNNNNPSFMTSIPDWAMRDYDDLIV